MGRSVTALALAAVFALAGVLHFTATHAFAGIVPPPLPGPLVVRVTGVMELVLAAGLAVGRTRRLAGLLLALYSVAVLPANIYMAFERIPVAGVVLPDAVLWLRVALQAPLIVLILWATRPPSSATPATHQP